jgi:hypothetical protein
VLLEVRDGDHQWQPGFPCRGFWRPIFVHQSSQVLLLKTANPLPDGGARDVQKAAHADLGPALTIEGNHLRAGLRTCRVAVVIQLREGRRGREGQVLPEPFEGFMIEPIARFLRDNPAMLCVHGSGLTS